MSKKIDLAAAAMQHAVEDKPERGSSIKNFELMKIFADTFKKSYPEGTFDVNTVIDWGVTYGELLFDNDDEEFELPPCFANTYALGKFLKKNQERLGIKKTGSYGNRAVYSVI